MSRFLIYVLSASFIVGAIASFLAPRFLSWYASPPVPIGVTCDMAISWAMEKLMLSQVIGLGIGAIIGMTLSFSVRKKKPTTQPS